ncbi:hypothetical protein B0H11DRAFT_408755 [Mycena galericulata]|nr:hypothetical protein B0H11DRAFT_408755 [Mycena galericulata]
MLVDRIITMTVHTGVLTSVCAILDLILYLVDPTGLHLAFNFPLCKLYTNSLISSLNCRSGWGYGPEDGGSGGTGSNSSYDEKVAYLPKPVLPPPPPKAAVMVHSDSLLAPEEHVPRPSVAKTDSNNSGSTAIGAGAPRKDSAATFVAEESQKS